MFEQIFGKSEEQKQAEAQAQAVQEQQVEDNTVATINALKDYSAKYDSEWIAFISELSKNESSKDIAKFIENTEWSNRQRTKIQSFTSIVLSKNLGTTFITGQRDYMSALDDYTLAECNIPLGMTVMDLSPEFNLLMDLIRQAFLLSLRRSKAGFFVERVGTSRIEVSKDGSRDEHGFKNQRKPGMLG